MSMLTPPGMGGKYRITGDKYPRMRPHRRRGRLALALVASVAALGLVGWGTLQLIDVFTGGDKASAAASSAACRKKAQSAAKVKAAGQRQAAPPKPGFVIGDVANAPKQYDKKVKGAGLLLGPSSALNTSLPVLGTQVAGAERRTEAGRKGAGLDLIIGDGFKGLAPRVVADQALAKLSAPASSATPEKGC